MHLIRKEGANIYLNLTSTPMDLEEGSFVLETGNKSNSKVIERFNEIVLMWKHEQKNLVGNKVKSILLERRLLTVHLKSIVDDFIDEVVDLSEY